MNYVVRINVSHLIDTQVIEVEDYDGNKEEGIFIPFKKNRIHKGKKHISLTALALEADRNTFGQSHFLIPYWGKYKEYLKRKATFGNPPYIGTMMPNRHKKNNIVNYNAMIGDDYISNILSKNKFEE